tara:strand:- start:135 stop:290 length:156 start_codon:yes stop_codon:yes gene_type:complete
VKKKLLWEKEILELQKQLRTPKELKTKNKKKESKCTLRFEEHYNEHSGWEE